MIAHRSLKNSRKMPGKKASFDVPCTVCLFDRQVGDPSLALFTTVWNRTELLNKGNVNESVGRHFFQSCQRRLVAPAASVGQKEVAEHHHAGRIAHLFRIDKVGVEEGQVLTLKLNPHQVLIVLNNVVRQHGDTDAA